MEMMLNKIVPEGLPYRHSCEGPDDMVRYIFISELFSGTYIKRIVFIHFVRPCR